MIKLMLLMLSLSAFAQEDAKMGVIHKVDLGVDTPAGASYILITFDIKKLGVAGARAYVVLRQMTKRVRAELTADGPPNGNYILAFAPGCEAASTEREFKSRWHEWYRFDISTAHTANEKSLAGAALHSGGKPTLEGQTLALFRIKGKQYQLIDCKVVH